MLNSSIQESCYLALMTNDPLIKCDMVTQLYRRFQLDKLCLNHQAAKQIENPGRPVKPELVRPKDVKKRGIASQAGRNRLMHAVAHIEFNAINLALDAVYRFARQPKQFYADWLQVAAEEAKHFLLVCDYLNANNIRYGDYPAHNGLWDMCQRTSHDLLARMALVPRVLEARGLDVTPGIINKLAAAGDQAAVSVLEVIYEDEIKHVKIGSNWFLYQCELAQLEPQKAFLDCVEQYLHGELRGPFNLTARQKAGFTKNELENLQKVIDLR